MIIQELESILGEKIDDVQVLTGGDVNHVYKIVSCGNNFVLKHNENENALDMFHAEADGLSELAKVGFKITPNVRGVHKLTSGACLLMEYIPPKTWTNTSFSRLGNSLAKIHLISDVSFGYKLNNFLANISQKNTQHKCFIDFYINCRISPLIIKLLDTGSLPMKYAKWCDRAYSILSNLIPKEPPALIHGDLWSGNILNSDSGPVLIDPAVYYGHREMDIAMTKLFGGFSDAFYQSYNETFPLEKGWEKRIDLFQLYPLLIHLCLFGKNYLGACIKTLQKYV